MGRAYLAKNHERCTLSNDDAKRIYERIQQLPDAVSGQFHNLDIKPLETTRRELWRLRVGDFRVIYQPASPHVIVLRVIRRTDTSYDDLDRIALVRRVDGLQVVESQEPPKEVVQEVPERAPITAAKREEQENPLTPFSAGELSTLGLDEPIIGVVRLLSDTVDIAQELADRGVDARTIELVTDAWFDPPRYLEKLQKGESLSATDTAMDESELARRAESTESSDALAELAAREFQLVLEKPVEDWMFYLHPSQARIVRHAPTGPSRVRGGPGTGKTVAAIHRARWLVREQGAKKVLLTTFINALPEVWEHLLKTFDPEVAAKIETRNVDSLAFLIVSRIDGRLRVIDSGKRRTLIGDVMRLTKGLQTAIGSVGNLETEFDTVLAGRRIETLEQYLEVERVGRKSALRAEARELVWQAYERYRTRLERDGETDFHQVRLRALEFAEEGRAPSFHGVVVDEAQDLSEVGIKLLAAVDKSENHSGFMLVGDGQQSIYPGGFSLRSTGMDVRGRSFLLRVNWRNTQSIATAAEHVIGDLPFGDLDDEVQPRAVDEMPVPRRLGNPVQLHRMSASFEEADLLSLLIGELLTAFAPSDVAVLSRTNRTWQAAEKQLRSEKVPTLRISDYRGGFVDGVRVGTFQGSKGLEFKAVVLWGVDEKRWAVTPNWLRDSGDIRDHWDRELRTLFVAMTRARDHLVLIGKGPLCKPVENALEHFDVFEWN
jgi:mRNA-degrading endonuclease RelE of RelBE toxin-antitoxin system